MEIQSNKIHDCYFLSLNSIRISPLKKLQLETSRCILVLLSNFRSANGTAKETNRNDKLVSLSEKPKQINCQREIECDKCSFRNFGTQYVRSRERDALVWIHIIPSHHLSSEKLVPFSSTNEFSGWSPDACSLSHSYVGAGRRARTQGRTRVISFCRDVYKVLGKKSFDHY